MPGIGIGISPHFQQNKSLLSYWATLISATVENAAPTDVVLTFPSEGTSVATDITATVNGVARTVSSASWTGAVWTVVLASAVEYGDVVVMTFKLTNTVTVTNNVLTYAALLTSTGNGTGVSTLRMQVSANITVTLGANAKFYSDSAGTADESATWTVTSGALRTIYLKCTTGTVTMTFSDASKITTLGNLGSSGWESSTNAASLTLKPKVFNITQIRISGNATLLGEMPSTLNAIYLDGANINWTYTGALPSGLNNLYLDGANINWTYTGALPSGLNGWNYLAGNNIRYSYDGALSGNVTYMRYNGSNINYTSLDFGGGNITTLNMQNFRSAKITSADMVTLLTNLTNRAGTLPTTITINEYADYASPPAEVVTAVNTLKATKGITTVNLGA